MKCYSNYYCWVLFISTQVYVTYHVMSENVHIELIAIFPRSFMENISKQCREINNQIVDFTLFVSSFLNKIKLNYSFLHLTHYYGPRTKSQPPLQIWYYLFFFFFKFPCQLKHNHSSIFPNRKTFFFFSFPNSQ